MAHVAPILPSFSRGEVSPLMYGRVDIQQYNTCLDKCRNMWVRPYGLASRLTGTEYINTAKNNGKVKLLKFVFSASDSYIIECGAGYFRFYQDGKSILKKSAETWLQDNEYKKGDFVTINDEIYYCEEDHTSNVFDNDLASKKWNKQNEYEIPNTFTEEQLSSIQYVQLDDIIKLTCLPVGDDYATAKPKELLRYASDKWVFRDVEFKETPYLDQNITEIKLTPSAVTGDITITASADFFNEKHVGANFWLGIKVLDEDENKEKQGFVKVTEFVDTKKVKAKVESKLSATSATAIWGEGAFSDYRGYPACVALYDGRLYYARTSHQPRNIYGSVPYAYEKFTPAVNNEDDGAINIELATNANGDGSDIKWIIGSSHLLCGTYGGEFVIRGTGDGAITPTDVSARQRTNWGVEPVAPVVAGSFVHFMQRTGKKLRQYQYDYMYDSFKAPDVSILSEHLLTSPIKQMAYQKAPDSILYLLREDGKVVLLSSEQDQSVSAWSLLEDMGGTVESIETIPAINNNFDEVYLLMNRQGLKTALTVDCSNPELKIENFYNETKDKTGIEAYNFTYSDTYTYSASNPFIETYIRLGKLYKMSSNEPIGNLQNITSIKDSAVISNGKLYQFDGTSFSELSNEEGWTDASGRNNTNSEKILAIKNGALYSNNQLINAEKTWVSVYGWCGKPSDSNAYGYAIDSENNLYSIHGNYDFPEIQTTKILSNCTKFSGYGGVDYNYAIANGSLYRLASGIATKVGSYTNWTDVVWYNRLGFAIRNNSLYLIKGTTATAITSDIKITKLSNPLAGFLGDMLLSFFVIGENCLARITFTDSDLTKAVVTKIFDGNFTDVQGYCSYDISKAITVLDNKVYKIIQNVSDDEVKGFSLEYIGGATSCWLDENNNEVELSKFGFEVEGTPIAGDTLTATYTTENSGILRYIERMQNPITQNNQNDWWYVRSGKKYNAYELTKDNKLTVINGENIVFKCEKDFFTAEMVGKTIRIAEENYNVLLEATVSRFINSKNVEIQTEQEVDEIALTGKLWGLGETVITDLNHLNEKEVQIFADGQFIGTKEVKENKIELDKPHFIILVGLPYQSYMTTLPIEMGAQNGTAVGKRKRIGEFSVRVWNSLGVKYGKDLNNLYDTIQNQTETYTGIIPNIKYNQGWDWIANITLEQSKPYPMNILAIAPILTEVDK